MSQRSQRMSLWVQVRYPFLQHGLRLGHLRCVGDEHGLRLFGKRVVAGSRAAGDLKVDGSLHKAVGFHQLVDLLRQKPAVPGKGQPDFPGALFQAFEMFGEVKGFPAVDADHLIDAVAELVTPVFDVHGCFASRDQSVVPQDHG